jgi:hypothetical protein
VPALRCPVAGQPGARVRLPAHPMLMCVGCCLSAGGCDCDRRVREGRGSSEEPGGRVHPFARCDDGARGGGRGRIKPPARPVDLATSSPAPLQRGARGQRGRSRVARRAVAWLPAVLGRSGGFIIFIALHRGQNLNLPLGKSNLLPPPPSARGQLVIICPLPQ